MASRSLFSILTRAPWWISALVAAGLFFLIRELLPQMIALAAAAPFLAIGGYAAWKQLRLPGDAALTSTISGLKAMSAEQFRGAMAAAFRRQGYAVENVDHATIDLELRKDMRLVVVSCKKWKVAHTGIGPLKELREAMRERDAHSCIHVSAGSISEQARRFAGDNAIRLIGQVELGTMLHKIKL